MKSNITKKEQDEAQVNNKFVELVRCSKDVFNSRSRNLFRDKNGRRLCWNHKKNIVKTLDSMECFIDESGKLISIKEAQQMNRLSKMEEQLDELSNSFRSALPGANQQQ